MEDLKHEIKDTKGCDKRHHVSCLTSPVVSRLTSHATAPWPKVKLGEIGRVAMCKRVLNRETADTGEIPFFKIGTFGKKANAFITRDKFEYYRTHYSYPQKGNVLISAAGTIGRLVVFNGEPAYFQDSNIVWLEHDGQRLCDKYLYYFLLGHEWQFTQGATIQRLYNDDIRSTEIPLPPLPVQRRIADVLSAYDNLIENNRRRIAILEETARLTYRKWFGGMEEGRTTTLGDVLEVLESGSRPRGGAVNDGVPSIGAEKIESIGIYDYSSEKYVSREYYDKMRRGKIRSGDVLLYKDGAYTGKVSMALNGFPHVEAAVNEHVFILRTRNLHAQCFLYCFLRQQEIYERINTIASAKACQPGLNQSDVLNLEIELPTGDEIGRFEDKVISFFDEIVNLAKQNAALAAARDMLLPRLMKCGTM